MLSWYTGASGPYPRPVSRHTYDQLVVASDEFIMLSYVSGRGSCAFPGLKDGDVNSAARVAHYNLNTNTWSFSPTAQGDTLPFSTHSFPGTEYDPISGNILIVGRSGMYLYNPTTREKSRILNFSIGEMGIEGNLVYYPPNQKFYFFGDNYTGVVKVWEVTFDRVNPANSTVTLLATSGTPPSNRRPFAYDSQNQVIGGGISGNQFYVFDPITRSWFSQIMQGANTWGVSFQAFDYDPINNVYVYISQNPTNGFDRRTWVYRYKGGAGATDTTPPSIPTNLTATAVSSSQINISWNASTDNVGVTGYKIYRNGSQIATSSTTSYSDTGLSAGTTYIYTVAAYDAAGNTSITIFTGISEHAPTSTPLGRPQQRQPSQRP